MTLADASQSYLEELIDDFDSEYEENSLISYCPNKERFVSNQEMYLRSFFPSKIIVLPVEILTELSRFLDIHDIRSLMNVCKLWNQIFRRDEIWRGLFSRHMERSNKCDSQPPSPHDCVHYQGDQGFCLVCGQESSQSNSDLGFVIVSSPQHLAQLLSAERQRIELMEMNRHGEEIPLSTPTKILTQAVIEAKPEWNFHIAIPSSFLSPNPSMKIPLQGSLQCTLEEDYSSLPQGKWYFRYKQHHNEKFCSRTWKSLSESWKWLRSVLRDQLYISWKLSFATNQFSCSHRPVSASTVTRAAAKLTSVNWIRFYETIKEEMKLQADALARDVVSTYSLLLADSSPENHLSLVKYTCEICNVYISWCSELESLLIPLNSRISDDQETDLHLSTERFKRNREGEFIHQGDHHSSDSQRTPHITDLCCLILRSRCLLQWEISSTLKHSIQILCNDLEERSLMRTHQHPSSDGRRGDPPSDQKDSIDSDEQHESVLNTIIKLYELIQSLDVPDDASCSHFRYDHEMNQHLSSASLYTRGIFRSCYYNFLMTQNILLPHLRSYDRKKKDEMLIL